MLNDRAIKVSYVPLPVSATTTLAAGSLHRWRLLSLLGQFLSFLTTILIISSIEFMLKVKGINMLK